MYFVQNARKQSLFEQSGAAFDWWIDYSDMTLIKVIGEGAIGKVGEGRGLWQLQHVQEQCCICFRLLCSASGGCMEGGRLLQLANLPSAAELSCLAHLSCHPVLGDQR